MMETRVAAVPCSSYQRDEVREAVRKATAPFGGVAAFVHAGDRVCLKVNLLRLAPPEDAVTTHPAVVAAVAAEVRAAGAVAVVADSPGGGLPYNRATLERCYRRAGYLPLAEEGLIELNYDPSHEGVFYPRGKIARRFNVITPVRRADAVINVCKLKTHAFTYLTGAVKNLFGVVPGFDKPAFHGRLRSVDLFAEMLLDVAAYVQPALNVMDAVIAMEGNGPGLGEPRPAGLILASPAALAIDCAAGVVTGLSPRLHPVLRVAAGRGWTPATPAELTPLGAPLLPLPHWRWPPTVVSEHGFAGYGPFQGILSKIFREGFTVRPRVEKRRCLRCGECREACPVDAITIAEDAARINDRRCIRCYCCHEACGYDAISLRGGLVRRLTAALASEGKD